MVTPNPLADFVAGMDARTARCLAAVERACDAGMRTTRVLASRTREFCTWYRIAAVHERDRVARAVHAVCATSLRVRVLDAAITVLAYDAARCRQYPYIASEFDDLRVYMNHETEMGFPYAYDTYMQFVPERQSMLRPSRGVKGGIAALEREFAHTHPWCAPPRCFRHCSMPLRKKPCAATPTQCLGMAVTSRRTWR